MAVVVGGSANFGCRPKKYFAILEYT